MKAVNVDTLPPLPYVAHEILLALHSEEASVDHISEVLGREPGLTARIVALANAASFARQRTVYSIDEAVLRLGLDRVRVLSASLLLAQQFDTGRCPAFRPDVYWLSAVGTAFATGRLSRHLQPPVDPEAAYLAGLLHNIGLLLLAHVFPAETDRILRAHDPAADGSLAEALRGALGSDHHQAGAMLLEAWALPEAVASTAQQAGSAPKMGQWAGLAQCVQFCASWTALGFERLPDAAPPPGPDDRTLERVGAACGGEWEQLQGFAGLLAEA
ncbi:HDOD domain-containing protein [Ectothiorhodospiraceae bacterium WFHF3C12]|nr:HDOD domain-containing protein [Ectothiorhodospiraceae bacterium WFHF3C12]